MDELSISDTYLIEGKAQHHLVNVVRIKVGEQLLLLNGNGRSVLTTVESVSKRNIELAFIEDRSGSRSYVFDLALAMPKKEALESCLKQATELGFRRVFLIRSDYSQSKMPEQERTQKLLVSALEQSNALFLPEVLPAVWESLPWEEYESVIMMDSQSPSESRINSLKKNGSHLLIIGPEGGFSEKEKNDLQSKKKLKVVKLPTPILRTPTALATGAGILLQSLLD